MNKHLQNILDTMAGTDGDIKFTKFKKAIEIFELQALQGDEASKEILLLVEKFIRLNEYSKKL